jgi:hypothetical protein
MEIDAQQAIRDGPSQAGFAHLLGRSMATLGDQEATHWEMNA